MYCVYCGNQMSDNAKFCSRCGKANVMSKKEITPTIEVSNDMRPITNVFAIISYIFAFALPPLGIIFSIIGLVKKDNYQDSGKALLIGSIIISIIFSLFWILIIRVIINIDWNEIEKDETENLIKYIFYMRK